MNLELVFSVMGLISHTMQNQSAWFFHLAALSIMTEKHLLADAVTIIGTQELFLGK